MLFSLLRECVRELSAHSGGIGYFFYVLLTPRATPPKHSDSYPKIHFALTFHARFTQNANIDSLLHPTNPVFTRAFVTLSSLY